jgi:uncharacterized protein
MPPGARFVALRTIGWVPRRLARLPCLVAAGLRVVVAAGPAARLAGLAGLRTPPPPGVALLLAPCRSVHTLGMRWALDLVWLGAGGEVVRVDRGVPPGRVRRCRAARAVLEVPAGGADAVLGATSTAH